MKLTIDDVRSRFIKHFDGTTGTVYAAPGRINLIGEHTDYNGGFVFPGAVEQGIIAELKPNGTRLIKAYSIDLKDYYEFSLDDEKGPRSTHFRYIFGVAKEMMKLGVKVEGFNIAFAGDVPQGSGMSSSAALESCVAYALNDTFNGNIDPMTLAKVGQATEHNYVGVKCGIMDQFAAMHGKKNNLMRLDCRSGEFEYFPWQPKGYKLVLINSCVKHELVGSPYNERRESCERVVAAVKAFKPEAETLRDCTWEDLEKVKEQISEVDYRRAKFVLGEVDRVLAVCEALKQNDYETVGEKMYETHDGLSKDYEVSCEETDYLVDIARDCGVSGARIMGGGFGGCTINLVQKDLYPTFIEQVKANYNEKFGKACKIIDVVIGDGARKLC
ncbi:MAG: galactokinase [Prevotellaceae bacterium]|nr:galactokinase [Candidatus Colivivens caballi]